MSFSEASNRELNDELQVLVATGDESARQRMIEGNMRLVAYKVEQFLALFPQYAYLNDDLLGEGMLGLTSAVNSIREVGDNPTGLISLCITQSLGRVIEEEGVMRVPPRTQQKHRQYDKAARTQHNDTVMESLVDDTTSVDTLRDTIIGCCWSETERTIVRLREDGHSDAEIAKLLDQPRSTIQLLRKGIYERVKKELEIE